MYVCMYVCLDRNSIEKGIVYAYSILLLIQPPRVTQPGLPLHRG